MTIKLFNLDPLPHEDSHMGCAQDIKLLEWPYVKRCNVAAIGLIPKDLYVIMKTPGGGRAVCNWCHKSLDDDLAVSEESEEFYRKFYGDNND